MILCIIHWKIAKTDTYFHFKLIIIFYLTLLLGFIYNTLILHGDKSCISMVFLKPQNMHTSLIQNWGFVVLVALDWDIDRPSSWDHVMDLTLEMLWMRDCGSTALTSCLFDHKLSSCMVLHISTLFLVKALTGLTESSLFCIFHVLL